ncbi:MAG: urease subunit beta [Veillonellales bacterium]
MIPGEIFVKSKEILCNAGEKTIKIAVKNTGDRPIQVGSHFHLFEANRSLDFTREKAFGMRLNIPAGTGVRFQPGECKEVELVELSGNKEVYGLHGMTNGKTTDDELKSKALKKLQESGFKGA